jgi:hypothetical protein
MTKKNAHATYLNVKGTFLSVSAFDYQEENEKSNFIQSDTTINNEQDDAVVSVQSKDETISEEKNMSKLSTGEVEEDILDVVSTLSNALASNDENENSETEEVAEDATAVDEGEESTDATETEESEEEVVESADNEEQLTDEESIESPEEQATAEVTTTAEEAQTEESAEGENPELIDLRAKLDSLREENVKLKKALHYTLAERVVDAKISAGLMESADRASALEDHASRTPSSLADALRDLEKMNRKIGINREKIVELDTKAHATGNAGESEIVDEDVKETAPAKAPVAVLEDVLVDRLMNRKHF